MDIRKEMEVMDEEDKKLLDAILDHFAEQISEGTDTPFDEARDSLIELIDKRLVKLNIDEEDNITLEATEGGMGVYFERMGMPLLAEELFKKYNFNMDD